MPSAMPKADEVRAMYQKWCAAKKPPIESFARNIGEPASTVRRWINQYVVRLEVAEAPEFEIAEIPDALLPVEDLVERRKRQFAQKKKHEEARKLIPIKIKKTGAIGILHYGDPHVDDDGTDLSLLEHHMHLTNTVEGLYGANIGDTTNNWVGRLARLYAAQSTSAAESWQLAEWFIRGTNWMYMIGGNHDAWSGDGDPIRWIAGEINATYQDSEARLQLNFPNGKHVRINARHDFTGHSMYNPVHGATKALHFGIRDHVAVCGHKHVSGYGVLKDPDSGITMHALQIASYKVYDRYAREKGFRDQALSPCAVTVINPDLDPQSPDLIKVFWDADEGANYLKFLRRKK
ncbi:hypothetical protein [Sulfuriferula sp.]